MRAVRLTSTGGPDELMPAEVPDPEPGPGEVLVDVAASGLNFVDTYHRTGAYDLSLPAVPGVEAAGTVAAVGDGVTDPGPGDRVAWCGEPGTYAERAVVAADRLVPVPEGLDVELAAAVLLQGMTAHFLTRDTYPLGDGDTAVVLAAAGGVGHLLVQLAARRGARVIATASTAEKARLARESGADEVVRYTEEPLSDSVRDLTGGRGADVVYDSVGRATFADSLDSLRLRGMLVLYGQSSGPVDPVDPQVLNRKGSLFLTRPSLFHHIRERDELLDHAGAVLGAADDGTLRVRVDRRFPLEEAAAAHRYIEGRNTRGKVLLVP